MTEGERLQQGMAVTQRIWERGRAERIQQALERLSPGLREYANFGWSLYTGPALDQKTRSLCTVAALVVLGHADELKLHIAGALNNSAPSGVYPKPGGLRPVNRELIPHLSL